MSAPLEAIVNELRESIAALWARLNTISNNAGQVVITSGSVAGSSPLNADNLLIGTADATNLPSGIVVGTTPGGELGGTWASPTVDATHSGSTHAAAGSTHIANATDAHDASAISLLDTGGYYTATDVEAALAELGAAGDTSTVSTVSTTDATQATLQTIAAPATTTMAIETRVVARRTGGVLGTAEDGASYLIYATVKNVAGTATLVGAVVSLSVNEDQVLWDATIDVSGGNARVRVTGAAQNNVDWKCSTQLLMVT